MSGRWGEIIEDLIENKYIYREYGEEIIEMMEFP